MQATEARADASLQDWLVNEMPPGYRNRVAEIARLTAELEAMGRYSGLLCEAGAPLAEAARDLFASLGFETELTSANGCSGLTVTLEGRSRLLLHVSGATAPIERKSAEIAHVFRLLHEEAGEHDQVVLLANSSTSLPPSGRPDALAADADAFLTRMGARHVTGPVLFGVWKLSLDDPDRARQQLKRLHAHEI